MYINQLANIRPDARHLLAQSFSFCGAGMNIEYDTFVEKINRLMQIKSSFVQYWNDQQAATALGSCNGAL